MKITDEEFSEIVRKSFSRAEVCEKMNKKSNGNSYSHVNKRVNRLKLNITHFRKNRFQKRKKRKCLKCGVEFLPNKNSQKTCSKSCSNQLVPRGHATVRTKYRTICFHNNEKKCVCCDEYKIVEVHHFDKNRKNNSIENLIPLCPTHHAYIHSEFAEEVMKKVLEFRKTLL